MCIFAAFTAVIGCDIAAVATDDTPSLKATLAPTSSNIKEGQDFIDDDGRRWINRGKIKFSESITAQAPPTSTATTPFPEDKKLNREELAESLRPRRRVGDYEYQLAEPDYFLADKIIAAGNTPPPDTDAHAPDAKNSAAVSDKGLSPQVFSSPDGRTQTLYTGTFPYSAVGQIPVPGYAAAGCTISMIGQSTAIGAAHCFYGPGGWISSGKAAFGANNFGGVYLPYGEYYFDSITLPGGWNGTDLNWDFAVIEFSPTRFPGSTTGWLGTSQNTNNSTLIGYSGHNFSGVNPYRSQWYRAATYTSTSGNFYYNTAVDVDLYGDSGGCYFDSASRCSAIVSGEDLSSSPWRNVARRWDSTLYTFFDTYGNWP